MLGASMRVQQKAQQTGRASSADWLESLHRLHHSQDVGARHAVEPGQGADAFAGGVPGDDVGPLLDCGLRQPAQRLAFALGVSQA